MERAEGCPYKLDQEKVAYFAAHFDHHDPEFGQDPYPVLRAMQEKGPITWSDNYGGFWIVTGYDEAHWIWQKFDLFATQPSVSVPAGLGHHRPMLPLEVDPPEHGKYRALLAPFFSPGHVATLEPEVRQTCSRLIDAFIDRRECEFISELAQPLPTEIFVKLVGIPSEEAGDFTQWNHDILHGQHKDPSGALRQKAGAAARARLEQLMVQRQSEGGTGGDIISILVRSTVDDRPVTDDEILDTAFLFFLAGLDTLQGELGFHFAFLSQHPEHRDRLVREPQLIPKALEELLRWEGLNISGRNVTRDIEYAGVKMKKGDPIVLVNRAANRDPRIYNQPDDVNFDRESSRNLTFAVGPHRCIGSHLARLELRVVHEEMHRRIPDYRLKDGEEISIHCGNVSGVDALPLVWGR
jgi:cytochrome P450